MDPNPIWMVSLSIKRGNLNTEIQIEGRHRKHRQNAFCKPRLPEAGIGAGAASPRQSSEGANSADTLILDIQLPELWEIRFCCSGHLSLCYFATTALENLYRGDHVTQATQIRMSLRSSTEAIGEEKISFRLQVWGSNTGASRGAKWTQPAWRWSSRS